MRGRPHYYSQKKEEYAHIKFDLDTGTWASTTPQRRSYPATLALLTSSIIRPLYSLQLEYKASLPLHNHNVPFSQSIGAAITGYHLGCHPPIFLSAVAS